MTVPYTVGACRRVQGYHPTEIQRTVDAMPSGGGPVHLVDGAGLLCGAKLTEPWVINEARVTCRACRAHIAEREQARRARTRLAVLTLARILKDRDL